MGRAWRGWDGHGAMQEEEWRCAEAGLLRHAGSWPHWSRVEGRVLHGLQPDIWLLCPLAVCGGAEQRAGARGARLPHVSRARRCPSKAAHEWRRSGRLTNAVLCSSCGCLVPAPPPPRAPQLLRAGHQPRHVDAVAAHARGAHVDWHRLLGGERRPLTGRDRRLASASYAVRAPLLSPASSSAAARRPHDRGPTDACVALAAPWPALCLLTCAEPARVP